MRIIPVGTTVISRFGQVGVVCERVSPLWPTLTPVRWVGTTFHTYEDHRKLEIIEPAASFMVTGAEYHRNLSAVAS